MNFFSLFQKKEKPKTYQITEGEINDVNLICSLVKTEFVGLDHLEADSLKITQETISESLNLKLAGYIVGLYDAHTQIENRPFSEIALELIVNVLFGEKSATIFIREFRVIMLTTSSKLENPFALAYDDFINARNIAGNEYFAWRKKERSGINGLRKIFK